MHVFHVVYNVICAPPPILLVLHLNHTPTGAVVATLGLKKLFTLGGWLTEKRKFRKDKGCDQGQVEMDETEKRIGLLC